MRWSAEKLRWLSLGGALLLAAVVAAFFGLARYTRGKVWQRILARNGVNLVQESNSVTYSQSVRGRTVFTVHAAKSVPHGHGQYTLRDAVLILYGKDGRNDRISGTQFEYDQNEEVLRAIGEVHMDLEAPQAAGGRALKGSATELTFTPTDETAEDPGLIHVRTSGVVYVRKLGVAATSELAEFRYRGITCTSKGAEFDSGQNILRLLADVQMTGTVRNQPFTLTAVHADLDRTANTADLREPRVESGKRRASAEHALLHLGKDGSLQAGDADGDVRLSSETQTISSSRLHGDFGSQERLQHALFSGGVTFADTNGARPANGTAQTLDLKMNAQGILSSATGDGGVSLEVKETGAAGAPAMRQMRAQRAVASFVTDPADAKRSVMHVLQMTGGAEFSAQSPANRGQMTLTRVDADELTTTFGPGTGRNPQPQRMAGAGHTQLTQDGADGARALSTGEALDVRFAQRPGATGEMTEVSTALQTGHVVLHSWPAVKAGAAAQGSSTGYAQQALFEAAEGTLTLTGAGEATAEVENAGTQIRAPKIVLQQGTGDAAAEGGVVASSGDEAGGGPVTHVLAERAQLLHGSGISEFFGSDARPAQMWQGGSQVRAARIVLDGQRHTISARPESPAGVVNAVFASAGQDGAANPRLPAGSAKGAGDADRVDRGPAGAPGARLTETSRDTVLLRAAALDYNDALHQAIFGGGVQMRDPAGTVTGKRAAVFLQPPAPRPVATPNPGARTPEMGGKLERAVVIGDVRVTEPGRTGAGEQITYTSASNNYVLTGTPTSPPWVRDEQQGYITGTALVFGASDSSIVVTGTHAPGNQGKPVRVHTESEIKRP